MDAPAYFTVEEIDEVLRVDPQTVRVWLRTGKLKGIKAGRLWRVTRSDREAFLQRAELAQLPGRLQAPAPTPDEHAPLVHRPQGPRIPYPGAKDYAA